MRAKHRPWSLNFPHSLVANVAASTTVRWERGRDGWKRVAKLVSDQNEDFFLDALLASDEDIEKFEKVNFFTQSSWSKVRHVSELSEQDREELFASESSGSNEDEDTVSSINTIGGRRDHYKWILSKTNSLLSEPNFSDDVRSLERSALSVSADAETEVQITVDLSGNKEKNDLNNSVLNAQIPVPAEKTPIDNADQNINAPPINQTEQKAFATAKLEKQPTVITKPSSNTTIISNGSKENETNRVVSDLMKKSTPCSKPALQDSQIIKQSSTNMSLQDMELFPALKISPCKERTNDSQNTAMSTFSKPKSSLNTSFIKNIDCSKTSKETCEKPEKIEESKNEATSQKMVNPTRYRLRTNKVESPYNPNPSASPAQKTQVAKEPTKKVDSNGWTTFSSKKGKHTTNGQFFKNLQVIENVSNQPETTQRSPDSLEGETSKTQCQEEESNVKTSYETEERGIDSKNSEALEKRNLKRQRENQKAKEKARQAKEEKKRVKELIRLEQEKELEIRKKQKQQEEEEAFKKRNQEIVELRQERGKEKEERQIKRSSKNCDKNMEDLLHCRENMAEYLKEKGIKYRLIATRCYLAIRLKDLSEADNSLQINEAKRKIIIEFKERLAALERKNKLMMFISHTVGEKEKTFKLEEMLEYMHNDMFNLPNEALNTVQRFIRDGYNRWVEETKPENSEIMVKSMKFAESLAKKIVSMEEINDVYEQMLFMLKEYKDFHHDIFEFIGIATYLYPRINNDLFVLEEDYLLNAKDFDQLENEKAKTNTNADKNKNERHPKTNNAEREEMVVKKKNHSNGKITSKEADLDDEKEDENPECQDLSTQTEDV
uniref:Uncharacterized protein n=1 Tax=Caenorhabditis japonica TaxID=281687 RepID=A0A8R1I2K2_CAEJA